MEKGDVFIYPLSLSGGRDEYSVDKIIGDLVHVSWDTGSSTINVQAFNDILQSGHIKIIYNQFNLIPKWVRKYKIINKLRPIPITFKKNRNPYKEPNLYVWSDDSV